MAEAEDGNQSWPRRTFSGRPWRVVAAALVLSVLSVLALFLVLLALWRTGVVEAPMVVRDLLGDGPKTLNLVMVMPSDEKRDQFDEGLKLAMDEVNAAGGLAGLPITLKREVEDAYSEDAQLEVVVADTLALADRVSSMKDLLAVTGHWTSATALPASSVYNRRGVLYLSSHARSSRLTNRGFNYIFSLQLNNADTASMMAHYAITEGMRKFVVLGDDTDYGQHTATMFSGWATLGGGDVLFRGSVTSYRRSVDRLLLYFLDNDVFAKDDIDAFFIASSSVQQTAHFIRRARELGLTMPILGPGYIFSSEIVRLVGKDKMKDVAGVSIYDERALTPKARAFVEAYKRTYDKPPDQMAAVGYDAVHLLAHAVAQAGSYDASKLADYLRIMRHEKVFVGATGPLVFNVNGRVTDTQAFIVRHDGTNFHTVASYQKPLDWDPGGLLQRQDYRP